MEIQNFNLNLKSSEEQTVVAHSTNQNAFLIQIQFRATIEDCTAKIESVAFFIHHLNNTLLYNRIHKATFQAKSDTEPNHKFYLCMDVKDKPEFGPTPADTDGLELKINGGEIIEFHLDYSDECLEGSINSGRWPCNEVVAN